MQPNTQPTQSGERVSQGLNGVRERARKNKQERFTALLHHVNNDLLRESFYGLKRKAAPGVDGVTWKEYETGLEDRLSDLHGRVHRGAYRALPSKRKWIPKANGKLRPLGIAALEDKIPKGRTGLRPPASRGDGPQPDLRGRLSGLFLRVSSGTQPTSGAGCALCGNPGKESELDTRHGSEGLFRQHR